MNRRTDRPAAVVGFGLPGGYGWERLYGRSAFLCKRLVSRRGGRALEVLHAQGREAGEIQVCCVEGDEFGLVAEGEGGGQQL